MSAIALMLLVVAVLLVGFGILMSYLNKRSVDKMVRVLYTPQKKPLLPMEDRKNR